MENIIKQLKKGAQHTRLSATEKADMRNVLVRHVQANPVMNFVETKKAYSIFSPLQINNLRNKKTMPILVILGLLMGGSASFAAENTVPGDVLYPVKVHVNESVRGAVAVSPAAKAEWEVKLVERRLEEVKKLATTPNVAPEAQVQAQENLVTYTQHVEDRIAKFEENEDGEDAIKTSSNLSNVLAAYEQLLAAIAATQPTSTGVVAAGTATTTPATTATSTATTTTNVAASSTPATALTPANIAALREVLNKLSEVHGDAEEKHKELKKKYHHEEEGDEDNSNEDEEDHVLGNSPAVVSTAAATSTTTTASSSVATSTVSATVSTSTVSHVEDRDTENHREEIRSSEGTNAARVEGSRKEEKKRVESQSTNDND